MNVAAAAAPAIDVPVTAAATALADGPAAATGMGEER